MLSNCTYSVCQVIGILKITYLFKLYKTCKGIFTNNMGCIRTVVYGNTLEQFSDF